MKIIFLSVAIALSTMAHAQVNSVSLQASGLTCSMCSNAINKALKTLDFIQKVDADISTYTFIISFKPGSVVTNKPAVIQHKTFIFLNSKDQVLNGVRQVKIIDKGFVSAKEYKKNALVASAPQTYHVTL